MLFICLNGDIERQFEFVQQNWVNNSVFSGLGCEQDGLVRAPGDEPGCFTAQSASVRQRTLHIPSFIRVRGGAYFFLPGLATIRYLATLNGAGAETLPPSAFALGERASAFHRSPGVATAPRVGRPRGSAAASAAGLGRALPALDGGRDDPLAGSGRPTSQLLRQPLSRRMVGDRDREPARLPRGVRRDDLSAPRAVVRLAVPAGPATLDRKRDMASSARLSGARLPARARRDSLVGDRRGESRWPILLESVFFQSRGGRPWRGGSAHLAHARVEPAGAAAGRPAGPLLSTEPLVETTGGRGAVPGAVHPPVTVAVAIVALDRQQRSGGDRNRVH